MATLEDVRRIACSLPGAIEAPDGLAFSLTVKGKEKGFIWAWAERVHPKKPRVRNPGVFAMTVGSLSVKEVILGSDPTKYFTEPHYDGFPAILVRLAEVDNDDLEDLILEAWRCKAPVALVRQLEESG